MVVSIKTGFYAEMETDMKKLENKCMLITYSDSMGHNLADLNEILDKYFKNAVGGIHILPFFPSSGDRGFAPMDYHKVDPAFGDWSDVEHLAEKYYLMFDYMINHISAQSPYYKDFLEKKMHLSIMTCSSATKISGKTGSRPRSRWMQSTKESRVHRMWRHVLQTEHLKKYGARLMKSRSISTVNLRRQSVLSATT